MILLFYNNINIWLMDTIPVWLDCDPGHDDMLAIILAALDERIDLVGISTSAGNSTI